MRPPFVPGPCRQERAEDAARGRAEIPPIPRMTELDEEWIAWAAGTYAMTPEWARGMLAAFYTMRAKRLAIGIASIQRDITLGETAMFGLRSNESDPPDLVAKDLAMWQELLPQLRELAR